jgi:hypothetical protein
MAEWKKVIVSGSQADLAAVTASIAIKVGSNQQIGTTQATTFLTGSFTGSFSGNGSGLSGLIAAAGTVSSSAQTIAHLPTGTVSGSSQILAGTTIHSGSFFNGITVVSGSSQVLAGTSIHSGSFFAGITVVSGSSQVLNGSGVFSSSAQLPAGTVSGSSQVLAGTSIHSGSFFNGIAVVSGSSQVLYTGLSNTPAGIVSSSAQTIAHLPGGTVSGSSQLPAGIVSGSSQTIAHLPAGIVSSSVLAAGTSQGTLKLTTNGANPGDITATGLGTTGTPTFGGLTIATNALAVNNTNGITTNAGTFPIANTGATTINLGGAATAINIGGPTSITTINNDTRIKGTLYVDGPVTAISSSNLYVADKFILLASGSTGGTDGGIIVQTAGAGTGFAFGYDTADDRWVYQDSLAGTATNFGTITAYANTTQYGAANTKPSDVTGPAYGGGTGYGNTWVSTDTQEIWIYA